MENNNNNEQIQNNNPVLVQQQQELQVNNTQKEVLPKKRSQKGLVVAIIVLLVVFTGGVLFYVLVLNSPKANFLSAINKSYKSFETSFQQLTANSFLNNRSSSIEGSLDFKISIDTLENEEARMILDELNKISLNYKLATDKANKKIQANMLFLYDKSTSFNIDAYLQNSNAYVYLKDIFSKYIEIPVENYDSYFENIDMEELEYFVDFIKNSTLNSLEEKDFVNGTETITIDGKEMSTSKITYVLTPSKLNKILISVLSDVNSDKKCINLMSELSGTPVTDVKKKINELIESAKKNKPVDTGDELKMSIYFGGISGDPIKYMAEIKSISNSQTIEYIDYNKKKSLVAYMDTEKVFELLNEEISANEYKTSINVSNIVNMIINEKKENKNSNFTYSVMYNKEEIAKGTLNITNNEIEPNKKVDRSFGFTMNIMNSGVEECSLEINDKSTTTYDIALNDIDVTNKVKSDDLTDEDYQLFMENLKNNEFFKSLSEAYESLYSNTSPFDQTLNEYDYDNNEF